MKKLFSPTIKKLLLTVVSQGLVLGLSVITGFLLPKMMGPENFGYWQVYLFYLAYLNLFGFGFNDGIALFYGGYYYEDLPFTRLRASMKAVYLYQAVITAVGIAGVYLLCGAGTYRAIYLALMINVPITCLQCIILTTFLSVGRTEAYNIINLVLKALSVGFCLTLLFGGYRTPVPMILADTAARVIITVVCFVMGRRFLFGKSDTLKEGVAEVVEKSKAGVLITVATIASMLMPVLGRTIVERNEPIAAYGIYSFAMSLLTIILSFANVLGTVIFPILKRMDEEEMTNSYTRFSTVCNAFVSCALFLYVVLTFIVRYWMTQYLPALDYLHYLLAMCLPLARAQLLITPYYKAKRYEKQLFYANVLGVGAMFAVLLGAYFIFHSITAVAVGTMVVLTVWTFCAERYLNRGAQRRQMIRQTAGQVAVMACFCVAGSMTSIGLFAGIYAVTVAAYFVWMRKDIAALVRMYLKKDTVEE